MRSVGAPKLNKELLLRVADKIEKLEHENDSDIGPGVEAFTMAFFTYDIFEKNDHGEFVYNVCEAPACIAGWGCAIAYPDTPLKKYERRDYPETHRITDVAQRAYGLTTEEARALFDPQFHLPFLGIQNVSISPQDAAKVLRHLAQEEVVDWSVALD